MAKVSEAATTVAVFQLRAERELLQQVKEYAAKHQISANRFLVEAIQAKLKREKDQEWKEGFEGMGSDLDLDVEYMLPAGREVILGS